MNKQERFELEQQMQRQREEHQKKLDALEAAGKPMQTMVLDGANHIAYFVAKRPLEMEDTVVSIPFSKLMILLGQMMTQVVSPLFSGVRPASSGGGDQLPTKPDLSITS
jgi:hypothetical protein